jgi:hypothetical protein
MPAEPAPAGKVSLFKLIQKAMGGLRLNAQTLTPSGRDSTVKHAQRPSPNGVTPLNVQNFTFSDPGSFFIEIFCFSFN